MRHRSKRDEAIPLVLRIPARSITSFCNPSNGYSAGSLEPNVSVGIGNHQAEGRNVPGPGRFLEIGHILGTPHGEQCGQPAPFLVPKPL